MSSYQLHMVDTHSLHDDHPVSKWLLLLWVSSAKIGCSSDSGSRLQMRVSKAWTSHWCQVVTLPGCLTNLATIVTIYVLLEQMTVRLLQFSEL